MIESLSTSESEFKMRFPPEYKATARAKLIEISGALAKKAGFAITGMNAFAAAAEVTTGAFYSQFGSKSELLRAIVDHELSRTVAAFAGKTGEDLRRVVHWYLSPSHAAHPEKGCPIPALGPEIARADVKTRQEFEVLVQQLNSAIAVGTGDRAKAWSLLAQSIGGVILARAVISPEIQREILESVQATSVAFLEGS